LVSAMEAHEDEYMQGVGCGALLMVCGRSASVAACALQAGGRRAVAAAMQAHPGNEDVHDEGQEFCLISFTSRLNEGCCSHGGRP
jgi:hypothetical protein